MNAPRGLLFVAVFFLSLLGAGVPVLAEEEMLPDRFLFRLGGYHVRDADTIVRLDANDLPVGAYVDFSETLGVDSSAYVIRGDGRYRFNDHHALAFSWYALRFAGSKVLGTEIEWNGQVYPIGVQVNSKLSFDVFKLNYQYSLFHNEEAELGVSFGAHVMSASVGLAADALAQTGDHSVTAPLPVFGLYNEYRFSPRWSGYYNYQFFFINYQDKVKGGLQDFLLGMEYRLLRHLAVGAAYNRFALNLESKGDRSTLNLDTKWNGGMVYGAVYF